MKNRITTIVLVCVFLLGSLFSNAQKWEKLDKDAKKKSGEFIAGQISDKNTKFLKSAIAQDKKLINSQAKKLVELKAISKANDKALAANRHAIMEQKLKLDKVLAENPGSNAVKSIRSDLNKLRSETVSLKNKFVKNQTNISETKGVLKDLAEKVSKNRSAMRYITKLGNTIEYSDAVAAGGGTLGEIAAWWEGNSSFKNVIVRATREGGKAAVSIGTGIVVGSTTFASTWNPFLVGAAVVTASVAAEEAYDATAGKYLDKAMDNEYQAIVDEKYKPSEEQIWKRQQALRKKANEENKKLLKEVKNKQSEYLDELRKYIEERNRLWAEYEERVKQDEAKQLALETEQIPTVVQKPRKKKVKPGESVIIDIETTGGLLPIRYSGELSYLVENNSDRYLVAYKWTADKKMEPGIYEFTVRAKSASGKVGQNTVRIEVVDPNPKPIEKPKQTENYNTDTDGERLYSADELNIKEIPGAEIRKMIYKVNGIYYGHCQTPPDIKTQKFEIRLGVDPGNIEGKLGLAFLGQFAGRKTIPLSEEAIERMRKKMPGLPEERIPKTANVYFHAWGRERKFDPVSGRIWGELEGESSVYENYSPKADFKGFLEAKLTNGVISGTISFKMGNKDYSFPFTAKQ